MRVKGVGTIKVGSLSVYTEQGPELTCPSHGEFWTSGGNEHRLFRLCSRLGKVLHRRPWPGAEPSLPSLPVRWVRCRVGSKRPLPSIQPHHRGSPGPWTCQRPGGPGFREMKRPLG